MEPAVSVLIQVEVATLVQSLVGMMLTVRMMMLSKAIREEIYYLKRVLSGEFDERL